MDNQTEIAIISATSALGGVIVSQMSSLIISIYDKRNEKKKLLRQKYEERINEAVKIVEKEPYLESIFYAGLDSNTIPGKTLIKINTCRDMKFTKLPIKHYYFQVSLKGLELLRF